MAAEAPACCDFRLDACLAAKAEGNASYSTGDLVAASESYERSIALWDEAIAAAPRSAGPLSVSQLVRYDPRGYFGVVMSAFPLFDEYFLKDLGSDQAIWVGDAGGNLRRFDRRELQVVSREALDTRQAIAQNLAAVYIRREAWESAAKWADVALFIEGKAPKALMRKGAALLRLGQAGPASDVLATAAEVVPKDAEVRRLLREAEQKRSPTWVCATGCCGPWGIVCGGPVSSGANAMVVPPAASPSPAIGPSNFQRDMPKACDKSDCDSSCSSTSAPPTPRGGSDTASTATVATGLDARVGGGIRERLPPCRLVGSDSKPSVTQGVLESPTDKDTTASTGTCATSKDSAPAQHGGALSRCVWASVPLVILSSISATWLLAGNRSIITIA